MSVKLLAMVIILSIFVALNIYKYKKTGNLPSKYLSRGNCRKNWENTFSLKVFETIDEILTIFCDSFLFDTKYKYYFVKDDKILEIYKYIYSNKWQADTLEYENFALDLEKRYGIGFEELLQNEKCTIGDIITKVLHEKKAESLL